MWLVGILVSIAIIVFAILIAVPYSVELGIRRALPDHMLRPEEPKPVPTDKTECLRCGALIDATTESCWKCGWTYAR